MVLRLNGNMTDLEIAEAQEKNNLEARKEAEAVSNAKVKAISEQNEIAAKHKEAEEKAALEAENKQIKKQNARREAYLATPLTEGERVELQGLEAMCQTGQNPDKGNMFRLSDLRVKAKIKVKKEK